MNQGQVVSNHHVGEDASRAYKPPASSFSNPKQQGSSGDTLPNGLADFFSSEVFQIVLHNPTTAHRLLKFCEARMCGENMQFLELVDRYSTLLDELATVMTEIHHSHTSAEASRQLALDVGTLKKVNSDLREVTISTLPMMESVFTTAQAEVESLLRTAVYPRFVKYQLNNSASKALTTEREKYQGLGDCFCLTDPNKADNPIVFASDGFVAVTGYPRHEVDESLASSVVFNPDLLPIVPRNCRFLQGSHTDRGATRRLRGSIEAREETVELLLNYRKNGEPFWNLLYVAPLYDLTGKLAFFIGGQVNCSTTIRSNTDVLRILSMSDSTEEVELDGLSEKEPRFTKRSLFGFSRKADAPKSSKKVDVREDGMEPALLKKIGKMDFRTQMERFYTAYSKYLIIKYDSFAIEFYSPGIADMLDLNKLTARQMVGSNVFKVLSHHCAALPKEFRNRVQQSLKAGQHISASMKLFTPKSMQKNQEDKFFTHWTPTKEEQGQTKYVVMTISSTLYD